MWKDNAIVGRAVGIRTVSSATRKIERQRAMNASKVRIGTRGPISSIWPLSAVLSVAATGALCWSCSWCAHSILASTNDVDAMLGAFESEKELRATTEPSCAATLVVFGVDGGDDIVWDDVLQVLRKAPYSSFSAGAVAITRNW
jgi:hypothetical protein